MTDDSRLVARAQSGDAQAFEILVNRHGPMVYNLALRLVGDPLAAEDVAQDALIRAWRALPGFRADSRFSTWLYRIVTNVCLDHLPHMATDLAAIDIDKGEDELIACGRALPPPTLLPCRPTSPPISTRPLTPSPQVFGCCSPCATCCRD